ncbi:MAG: CocE/NonD family hydrolase [Parachlamydiaceae bacterium]|nr:CocE/NonD family hydrolase [Parachlamydiaceae bacterium]
MCFLLIFIPLIGADEIAPTSTVMVPMRDGTQLPTDLYIPQDLQDKPPFILIRSPGGRQAKSAKAYLFLVQLGYGVAIQDTRSAIDVEGKTMPYWTDGWGNQQDGFDAVEWLGHSPYSNGKIGTAGVSALGITQLLLAPTAPPSLKCQYIGMAAASLYHHAIFPGGHLLKNQVEGWLGLYAKSPDVRTCVCCQPYYNNFWSNFDTPKVAGNVKVPAVHCGGWYDIFLQGTIDAFTSRQEHGGEGAKGTQKLLIGPWTHFWPTNTKLGDFDVPAEGRAPPIDISPQRWFAHYLKDVDNGVETIPAVTYYVMGTFDGSPSSGNVWRHADVWPVPAASTSFYLTADHKLIEKGSSPVQAASFAYQYDSKNPVPTIGGCNLFLESGPKDQRSLEKREDVLLFTSEPLTEDLEVTGRVLAKVFFSSDQPDAEIVVRLCDVYPDGRSILITDNAARMSAQGKNPSKGPQEIDVDLWSTSIVFAKGHRLRLSITSSNYPRFEKDTLTENGNVAVLANNSLHVGGSHLSYFTLPIVRRGDKWLSEQTQKSKEIPLEFIDPLNTIDSVEFLEHEPEKTFSH